MKNLILIAVLSGLVGCASIHPVPPSVTEGNSVYVVIDVGNANIYEPSPAKIADQHCAGYGKAASYRSSSAFTYIYDCVQP